MGESVNVCGGEDGRCDVCWHPLPPSGVIRSCGGKLHRPFLPQPVTDLARTDSPSFLAKVKNFASATVQHVVAGMPMASDAEIIRRHDICLTCEHLQNDACNLCGCPVSRATGYVSKLSWADQECPAGKW